MRKKITSNEDFKIRLVVSCPGSYNKINPCERKPIEWTWSRCSHPTIIDDCGYCHCESCTIKHFLQNVRFKCSDKKHGNKYE
jgi:hypothetical protein